MKTSQAQGYVPLYRFRPITRARRTGTFRARFTGRSVRCTSVRMAPSKIDLYCHEVLPEPKRVPSQRPRAAIDLYCDETLSPPSPSRPPTPHRPGDLCTVDEMLRILVQNL